MSVTDPLANMFAQINNGQASGKKELAVPASKLNYAVAQVLKEEGYIEDSVTDNVSGKSKLIISLKYYKGAPVISMLKRVSKPGRRVYRSRENIPKVLGGLGVAIVTTSKGVMTDRDARERGLGGEILCYVS